MNTTPITLDDAKFIVNYDYQPPTKYFSERLIIEAVYAGTIELWEKLDSFWQKEIETQVWQIARQAYRVLGA